MRTAFPVPSVFGGHPEPGRELRRGKEEARQLRTSALVPTDKLDERGLKGIAVR